MATLFIIATPIGNLSDASPRSLETIASLDVLFCEDTRVTVRLLARNDLKVPLHSYRAEVHSQIMPKVIALLTEGKRVGFVSDAGTPGIADPGFMLVRDAVAAVPGLVVTPIPGPSAVTTALSASGFPADQFVFFGFPPHKKSRAGFFVALMDEPRTAVFYESPHRVRKAFESIAAIDPERRTVAFRELTKIHESTYRGKAAAVLEQLPDHEKGEYVIVVDRKPKEPRRK